jgi:HD-GYP domain-containing protein (c-di-GMP phosphodiesterase class II)
MLTLISWTKFKLTPYCDYYIAGFLLLAFYGVKVCPFIAGLSTFHLILPLLAIGCVQWQARSYLHKKYLNTLAKSNQVLPLFIGEWCIFAMGGALLLFYNSFVHDFPAGSGLKMVLGFSAIGFFTALIIALEHEGKVAKVALQDVDITFDTYSSFPLVRKFRLFAAVTLLLAFGTLALIVMNDINWTLNNQPQTSREALSGGVLIDFFYVGTVLMVYVLRVIISYSRNLALYFKWENDTLAAVEEGDLAARVPVFTRDEFGAMAMKTNGMIQTLQDRTKALEHTQDVTILALASLAQTRDNETGMHIRRTQYYVKALAEQLQQHPDFKTHLTDESIDLMFKSAPLHDIGKVGIPDAILLKPGKLTDDEFVIMKTHAELGETALLEAMGDTPETSFLRYARDIAGSHHEKWDGSGYPKGLKGDDIPFSARLMAVADVYDALISKRVYKPPFSHDKAISIIKEGSGTHFDPRIVEGLLAVETQFIEIAETYKDENLH